MRFWTEMICEADTAPARCAPPADNPRSHSAAIAKVSSDYLHTCPADGMALSGLYVGGWIRPNVCCDSELLKGVDQRRVLPQRCVGTQSALGAVSAMRRHSRPLHGLGLSTVNVGHQLERRGQLERRPDMASGHIAPATADSESRSL